MISPYRSLETTLPWSDYFMKGFSCRSEIIRIGRKLLVKITVNYRHPFIVLFNTALRFNLCLPCPVAVQIKIIMIGSASRPGFIMLSCPWIGNGLLSHHLVKPVYIPISSIGIQTRIYDNNRLFQPVANVCLLRTDQLIQNFHGYFRRTRFVTMNIITQPNNGRHVYICRFIIEHAC